MPLWPLIIAAFGITCHALARVHAPIRSRPPHLHALSITKYIQSANTALQYGPPGSGNRPGGVEVMLMIQDPTKNQTYHLIADSETANAMITPLTSSCPQIGNKPLAVAPFDGSNGQPKPEQTIQVCLHPVRVNRARLTYGVLCSTIARHQSPSHFKAITTLPFSPKTRTAPSPLTRSLPTSTPGSLLASTPRSVMPFLWSTPASRCRRTRSGCSAWPCWSGCATHSNRYACSVVGGPARGFRLEEAARGASTRSSLLRPL